MRGDVGLRQSSVDETSQLATEFEVLGYPNKIVTVQYDCYLPSISSESRRETIHRIRESITIKGAEP